MAEQSMCSLSVNSWYVPLGLSMGLSVAYMTLVFLLGFVFERDDIRDYAKKEVGELIFNLVIAIILIAFAQPLCLEKVYSSVFNETIKIRRYTVVLYVGTNMLYNTLSILANIQVEAGKSGVFTRGTPLGALSSIADFVKTFINTITVLLALYLVYISTLEIMGYLSFQYFIPVGLLLRMIPGLKRVGGALLGVGIVLGFLFPMLMKVTLDVISVVSLKYGVKLLWALVFAMQPLVVGLTSIGSIVIRGLLNTATGGRAILLVGGSLFLLLRPMGAVVMALIGMNAGGVFLINLIFTIVGVSMFAVLSREITALLGERLDVSSITRLI